MINRAKEFKVLKKIERMHGKIISCSFHKKYCNEQWREKHFKGFGFENGVIISKW